MLATPWPYVNTNYLPQRPSPLSPRSANACFRPAFGHYHMSKKSSGESTPRENTPFSKRAVKANPLLKSRDEQRERRRGLFMKKVVQGRDDARWEGRSDRILRSDYIAQQRRCEEERARAAPEVELELENDDNDNASPNSRQQQYEYPSTPRLSPYQADEEVDAMAQFEELELQELVALVDEDEVDIPSSPTRYGSDDEEYEDIFMEVLSSQEGAQKRQGGLSGIQEHHMLEDDNMDMTNG